MTTATMFLWRVEIRLALRHGKKNSVVHSYDVHAADAERAKALALAAWGYPDRAPLDRIANVMAEVWGVVASVGSYTVKGGSAEMPGTVPSAAEILDAKAFLDEVERAEAAADAAKVPLKA